MESNEVRDENISALMDTTNNINITSTKVQDPIMDENSSYQESELKTETNIELCKLSTVEDCEAKNLMALKSPVTIENDIVNKYVLARETNHEESVLNVTNRKEIQTCYTENNVIEGLQNITEIEKTLRNKNEVANQESLKFSELQLSIAHENDLAKSGSNDKSMDQDATMQELQIEERTRNHENQNETMLEDEQQRNEEHFSRSKENIDSITVEDIIDSVNSKSVKKPEIPKTITSLASIATAYENSDSEDDEPEDANEKQNIPKDSHEMEVQITKEYRSNPPVATSDEETDSDDSSDDAISLSVKGESDDSDDSTKKTTNCKKKNRYKASQEKELKGEFDDLPPIEELKISVPEVLCDPLGEVGWMVEQMVVVRPKPGKPTLNLDTILFVERGKRVLGRIFDVFGQVSEPHYCVRFNSSEHIQASDIKVGMIVYFCPNTEYTSVVFLQDLLKMKATDELGDDEHPEFSDDEEERAYYAALKQKQKNDKTKGNVEVPHKRQRTDGQDPGWKSNHPWSTGRKQQQNKKPSKMYETPDWSSGPQPSGCHPSNTWQYPSAYPNSPWPSHDTYQGNGWPPTCPQNAYGYNDQFTNRHQQGASRPFFRPPHAFQPRTDPYMHNAPYSPQSNPPRYPVMNFSWQSQTPRPPGISWPLPPPPPPPPGI